MTNDNTPENKTEAEKELTSEIKNKLRQRGSKSHTGPLHQFVKFS